MQRPKRSKYSAVQVSTPESPADIATAEEFIRAAYEMHGKGNRGIVLPDRGTTYVVSRNEKILGVTSILNGSDRLQLEDYYSSRIMEDFLPPDTSRESVIEIARTATARGTGATYLFFVTLMDLVRQHARQQGANYWLAMMKQPLVEMFQKHGWPLSILPVSPAPADPTDPMHTYLNNAPPVLLVLSPVDESIRVANRIRRQ